MHLISPIGCFVVVDAGPPFALPPCDSYPLPKFNSAEFHENLAVSFPIILLTNGQSNSNGTENITSLAEVINVHTVK